MAQAWHKSRERLAPTQEAQAGYWRATEYRLSETGTMRTSVEGNARSIWSTVAEGDPPAVVEAALGASWRRCNPFDSYRPTSKTREVEDAGPHVMFLRLRKIFEEQQDVFEKALLLFANRYGLLGEFERTYVQRPVLPNDKFLVAPEAVIDAKGRLRPVDPSTEGRELVFALKESHPDMLFEAWFRLRREDADPRSELGPLRPEEIETIKHEMIAMPSEARFVPKTAGNSFFDYDSSVELVPWEVVRENFGALLVLDEESRSGVSVLCTRERLFDCWVSHLFEHLISYFVDFPAPGEGPIEDLATQFGSYLRDVSPRAFVGEDGNLERGWRCDSLLEAMGLMLLLDSTGDNTIKRCESRGCPNYFRLGPQSKSRYCSGRCASRASTRRRRGQEP